MYNFTENLKTDYCERYMSREQAFCGNVKFFLERSTILFNRFSFIKILLKPCASIIVCNIVSTDLFGIYYAKVDKKASIYRFQWSCSRLHGFLQSEVVRFSSRMNFWHFLTFWYERVSLKYKNYLLIILKLEKIELYGCTGKPQTVTSKGVSFWGPRLIELKLVYRVS